jgi:2-dehydro-3-deoxygluconokinase
MLTFASRKMLSIGEAMVEMAPVADGLYRRAFAGDTFNTAWHLAQRIGLQATVGFVSRIGQDQLSNAFAAELAADGIDITGISCDPQRKMGLYVIELDGVERSFHYWRDSSAARLLADDPVELDRALQGAGLIHLSGITLAILSPAARQTLFSVLARARQTGAVVSFDPNIRPKLWSSAEEIRATVSAMLRITDIALPSFDDEAAHFHDISPQDTIRRMVAAGVREIVVKNGAGLVHHHFDGQTGDLSTPPVTDIRDTTGAGDAFNAGYLAARLIGLDPRQAIASGQGLAAEVLKHPGARAPKSAIAALPPLQA